MTLSEINIFIPSLYTFIADADLYLAAIKSMGYPDIVEEFTEILHYKHIAGFWQYETVFLQHRQNRISMDIIDFTEESKLSVSYNDTQRFHHTLIDGYLVVRQHLMLCEM